MCVAGTVGPLVAAQDGTDSSGGATTPDGSGLVLAAPLEAPAGDLPFDFGRASRRRQGSRMPSGLASLLPPTGPDVAGVFLSQLRGLLWVGLALLPLVLAPASVPCPCLRVLYYFPG
jgi:hypothetical protein